LGAVTRDTTTRHCGYGSSSSLEHSKLHWERLAADFAATAMESAHYAQLLLLHSVHRPSCPARSAGSASSKLKHRYLLYLPRARHCERAPGHVNRTDTICRPEDVVLVNNNVHYAGGKLAIVQGPRIHTYSVKTGLAPYQSSSLVLYFFSYQSLFSPSQLRLGRCCILLRRDVVQHHDIPSLQMKAVYMFQCIFSL
jgi:hypothetical protein